jgi:hypothetical protein
VEVSVHTFIVKGKKMRICAMDSFSALHRGHHPGPTIWRFLIFSQVGTLSNKADHMKIFVFRGELSFQQSTPPPTRFSLEEVDIQCYIAQFWSVYPVGSLFPNQFIFPVHEPNMTHSKRKNIVVPMYVETSIQANTRYINPKTQKARKRG